MLRPHGVANEKLDVKWACREIFLNSFLLAATFGVNSLIETLQSLIRKRILLMHLNFTSSVREVDSGTRPFV